MGRTGRDLSVLTAVVFITEYTAFAISVYREEGRKGQEAMAYVMTLLREIFRKRGRINFAFRYFMRTSSLI